MKIKIKTKFTPRVSLWSADKKVTDVTHTVTNDILSPDFLNVIIHIKFKKIRRIAMEKFFDFLDEHPFIAASVIGTIITVICCISEPLRTVTGYVFMLALLFRGLLLSYMVIINAIAFSAVSNGKIKTGIVLSILGGFIGSLLGETFENSGSKAIKIISAVCIWLCICIAVSGYIYLENDFRLFP